MAGNALHAVNADFLQTLGGSLEANDETVTPANATSNTTDINLTGVDMQRILVEKVWITNVLICRIKPKTIERLFLLVRCDSALIKPGAHPVPVHKDQIHSQLIREENIHQKQGRNMEQNSEA